MSVVSDSPEQITVVISKTCILLCIPKECYNIFPGLALVFSSLSDSVVLEQIRFVVRELFAEAKILISPLGPSIFRFCCFR